MAFVWVYMELADGGPLGLRIFRSELAVIAHAIQRGTPLAALQWNDDRSAAVAGGQSRTDPLLGPIVVMVTISKEEVHG